MHAQRAGWLQDEQDGQHDEVDRLQGNSRITFRRSMIGCRTSRIDCRTEIACYRTFCTLYKLQDEQDRQVEEQHRFRRNRIGKRSSVSFMMNRIGHRRCKIGAGCRMRRIGGRRSKIGVG
jgi:hypothetical protein